MSECVCVRVSVCVWVWVTCELYKDSIMGALGLLCLGFKAAETGPGTLIYHKGSLRNTVGGTISCY